MGLGLCIAPAQSSPTTSVSEQLADGFPAGALTNVYNLLQNFAGVIAGKRRAVAPSLYWL